MNYIENFLELTLEAAPWLILGLLIGGAMKALLPTKLLEKHLQGRGIASIIKAAILGAPLPLCSCGVIPAALGLRQAGASKPATVSFLVSTPETGVDSISVTYALMGPFMAVVRTIAALTSAITSGLLVSLFDKETQNISSSETTPSCSSTVENSSCCSEKKEVVEKASCCSTPSKKSASNKSCCDSSTPPQAQSLFARAVNGIKYAFTDLLDGIIFWLVVGMFFAAAVKTFLPADFLAQWGHGLPAMLIMVLAGIPMYICATASTPIATGLMLAGVSPGAALVLLLTGPATNISTLGIIGKELGKKSMAYYLLGTVLVALLAGLFVDWLVQQYGINIATQLQMGHGGLPSWLQWASLILLAALPARKFLLGKK